MKTLFIILAIWLTPIIITGLVLYRAMEKGQTIENFVYQHDLDEPTFWGPLLIPGINYVVCIITIAHFAYEVIKHWKK